MNDKPKARTQAIVSEAVSGDLVVFDESNMKAHSLSPVAASVWERCDGERSTRSIADELGLDEEIVKRAVADLSECALLDEGPLAIKISRRDAGKRFAKIGGAAFAAPLIYSVAIAPAMAAASCSSNGVACTTGTTCCSGKCDGGTCGSCCHNGNSGCCSTAADCCTGTTCTAGGKCTA